MMSFGLTLLIAVLSYVYLAKAAAIKCAADVTGVDLVNRNQTDVRLVVADGGKLPFPDRSFDFILLSYVLHHVADPRPVLSECRRVCRGRVIVVEDDPVWGRRLFEWGHHRFFCLLLRIRDKIWYHYPAEWRALFREVGLRVTEERSRWSGQSMPMKRILFVLEELGG